MVVADAESPGPSRKRPRLSLKYLKGGNEVKDTKNQSNDSNLTCESIDQSVDGQDTLDDVCTQAEAECDGEDQKIVPAVASLQNLGNTCFLNSVMQVLRYTPGFLHRLRDLYRDIITVEKLMKKESSNGEDGNSSDCGETIQAVELVKHMMSLYKSMERCEENHSEKATDDVMSMSLKPQHILNVIREINPMFEGNLQHDAQELLRCILCYLQDAEKEVEKMKSSLPPSILPQSSEPINPIMQRFLSAGKCCSRQNAPLRASPRKIGVKEEIIDDQMSLYSSPSKCRRPDILGQIEQTEAAKTNVLELSAPAEGDTASDIQDQCNNTETVTGITGLSCSQRSDHGIVKPGAKSSESASVGNKTAEKRTGAKSRKTNTRMACRKGVKDTDSKNGRKLKGEQPNREDRKSESENPMDEVDGSTESGRRGRKGGCSSRGTGRKVSRTEEGDGDNTQRSILGMLKKQVHMKRLGMRGAVLRKNSEDMGESTADGAGEGVNGGTVSTGEDRNHIADSDGTSIMYDTDSVIPHGSNLDVEQRLSLCNSPRKMVLKLEKCDHVCDSPQKSVNADLATLALSPYKTLNSGTKCSSTGRDLAREVNSVKHKLDFSEKGIEGKRVMGLDSMQTSPPGENRETLKLLPKRNRKDFVEKLFMGTMMLRTKCLECENSREKFEEFHDISVPVRKERSDESDDDTDDETDEDSCLKKLMDSFTEVERLRDDNKYFCDKCCRLVEAERSLHYEVLPDILTLHLKRFSTSSGMYGYVSKINDHVSIPLALPCLRYKCPSPCSRPDHRYMLYAIVTHAGVTLTSGHYLAYVKVIGGSNRANHNVQSKISLSSSNQIVRNGSSKSTNQGTNNKSAIHTPGKQYTNQWLECDDETVRVYSEEHFRRMLQGEDGALLGTPYVLFYHRAVPGS